MTVEPSVLGTAIDHVDFGILIYDQNLTIQVLNNAAAEILAIEEGEFGPGDSFEDFARRMAARGGYGSEGTSQERADGRIERARSFVPFIQDQRIFDGRYLEVVGKPLPDGNYLVTYRDITLRRQAEKRASDNERQFLQLYENTDQGYWHIDIKGETLDVNPALCHMLGYSRSRMIGCTIYDFVDDRNREVFESQLKLRQAGLFDSYEIELRHASGRNVPCINTPAPIYDEHGALQGVIGLWTDITDLKKSQRELREAKAALEVTNQDLHVQARERRRLFKQLEQSHRNLEKKVQERTRELKQARDDSVAANEAKSRFLTNMSHELRTPLNAIIGFSGLMMAKGDGLTGEAALQYSKYILESGNHLLNLISDLLDLGRIEEGHYEPDFESFGILEDVNGTCSLLQPMLMERGQELQCDYGGVNENVRVRADRRALRQIMINLITNASKYSPDNSTIHGAMSISGARLRIEIRDQGPGIDEAALEKAFERFERLRDPLHSGEGGTGIGLPISRQLAEAHGGKLWLESAPGKGTASILELPGCLEIRNGGQVESEDTTAQAFPRSSVSLNVLVAEDNSVNRHLIEDILEDLGHGVVTAVNGKRAIEACSLTVFDLVLLDIRMPVMDGIEAARQIRELPGYPDVPLVAVTANATERDRQRCLAAGLDHHLAKPLSIEPLAELIERLFENRSAGAA